MRAVPRGGRPPSVHAPCTRRPAHRTAVHETLERPGGRPCGLELATQIDNSTRASGGSPCPARRLRCEAARRGDARRATAARAPCLRWARATRDPRRLQTRAYRGALPGSVWGLDLCGVWLCVGSGCVGSGPLWGPVAPMHRTSGCVVPPWTPRAGSPRTGRWLALAPLAGACAMPMVSGGTDARCKLTVSQRSAFATRT
jgi:hypothetical protein